jgi:hypothetical protein
MRSATKNKIGKDPDYLAWIRALPCAVQDDEIPGGSPCGGPITAHHAGDHGSSQKAPDRTAIPLCFEHHQNGKHAAHVLGKKFWRFHGIRRNWLIRRLNAAYEAMQ